MSKKETLHIYTRVSTSNQIINIKPYGSSVGFQYLSRSYEMVEEISV